MEFIAFLIVGYAAIKKEKMVARKSDL